MGCLILRSEAGSRSIIREMNKLSLLLSSSGSGLGEYSFMLYYDPQADKLTGAAYEISHKELQKKAREHFREYDPIQSVEICRHPLPLTGTPGEEFYAYHAFVIIKSEKYWYSIEKNKEGIILQRSQHKDCVMDKLKREKRSTPISRVRYDSQMCGKSLILLLDFIHEKNLLKNEYKLLTDNCKYFAANVFNHLKCSNTKDCTVGYLQEALKRLIQQPDLP